MQLNQMTSWITLLSWHISIANHEQTIKFKSSPLGEVGSSTRIVFITWLTFGYFVIFTTRCSVTHIWRFKCYKNSFIAPCPSPSQATGMTLCERSRQSSRHEEWHLPLRGMLSPWQQHQTETSQVKTLRSVYWPNAVWFDSFESSSGKHTWADFWLDGLTQWNMEITQPQVTTCQINMSSCVNRLLLYKCECTKIWICTFTLVYTGFTAGLQKIRYGSCVSRNRNSPWAFCWVCSSIDTTWPDWEGRSLRRNYRHRTLIGTIVGTFIVEHTAGLTFHRRTHHRCRSSECWRCS